jgi:hypothetical protein
MKKQYSIVQDIDGLNWFLSNLGEEVVRVQRQLDCNKSIDAFIVSGKLDAMFTNLHNHNVTEEVGDDDDLRAPYVIMQGLIEKVLLKLGNMTIKGSIITPRMPTPLLLGSGDSFLDMMDFSGPLVYASFRNPILHELLYNGITVNAIYSKHVNTTALDGRNGLNIASYEYYKSEYTNLKDCPIIAKSEQEFPQAMVGAVYSVDGAVITVESAQAFRPGQSSHQKWAIKIGEPARNRRSDVEKMIAEYSDVPTSLSI